MLTHSRRRSAFTLVELLVVITIIAILVALTATAVMGVRRNMQQTNAEATLGKLDQKILQQMKKMDAQITDDLKKGGTDHPEVVAVLGACNGNKDLAKAVMMYARTRRDMPMTVTEATSNFAVCGYTYRASPAFAGLTGGNSIEDSAVCLYAIVAPLGLEGLENQVATNAAGHKYFTDGMNQPIGFVRLGYDGNANELNKYNPPFDPFYPNKNAQTGLYRDLSADFGGTFNAQVWNQVRVPTVPWLPPSAAYRPRTYHTAFCFSAGLNDDFEPGAGFYNGDNLFSYRLRKEGAKGD